MAKLYFRYGAMGSGKSIDLLKVAYNYEERGQKVYLITSALDTRYKEAEITTRIGISRKALAVNDEDNIFEIIKNLKDKIHCILVDEAQFLTRKQVYELSDVVDYLDIPVIAYGLRTDFKLEFFEGSQAFMEIADKIEEIKTICECSKKATVNLRMCDGKIITSGEKILIGGNDTYKSVCRKCYKKYVDLSRDLKNNN